MTNQARQSLISRIAMGGHVRYQCRDCESVWYEPDPEKHGWGCRYTALIQLFDAQQAVCEAAREALELYGKDGPTFALG